MDINHTNKEYTEDGPFQDIAHLTVKLERLKRVFLRHNPTSDGEIDYVALHAMAMDLGIVRTLPDLKKRVQYVTGNTRSTLNYKDCAMAMLGRRSTMCQRILRFSGQDGEYEKRPCWLDRMTPSYISHLEFTVTSGLLSPIALLPPPPPPSPADVGAMQNTGTYPAA
ncbi:allograft inflammatory factor 1-like isoform X2 [Engystomops pustulosus]